MATDETFKITIEIVAKAGRENVFVGLLGWLEKKLENVLAWIKYIKSAALH